MNGVLTIERIDDLSRFGQLRSEWSELLELSHSNCIFLTWEWLFTWWRHLAGGRRLFILTARCGRELTAIAPLALRPRRLRQLLPFYAVEFLGTGSVGSAYLDLIVRRGAEEETSHALAGYLRDRVPMLELTHLTSGSSAATALAAALRQRGWCSSEAKLSICSYSPLSGHSWESYLATLGREHRYNFKRKLRSLAREFDVRVHVVQSEAQRRDALAVLMALHQARWQDRGGSEAFHTAGLRAFHEALSRLALQRGWLRLAVLWLDGKPAASMYGFRYGDTFYVYQSGFDPAYQHYGPGTVILGLTIKRAIEEGSAEYDLLGGDEEYKVHWARDVRKLRRLEFYPPGARGVLYRQAMAWSRAGRRAAQQVLPKMITDWLVSGVRADHWRELDAARIR